MSTVKERPILFSGPMVTAILAGKKTQTRRIMKPQPVDVHAVTVRPDDVLIERWPKTDRSFTNFGRCETVKLKYTIGQRLWVRETGWEPKEPSVRELRDGADTWPKYVYDADGISDYETEDFKRWGWKRRPSIFMPRWASRITLEVTGVRVERLQDISEADALEEGVNTWSDSGNPATWKYRCLWEYINGQDSWAASPFVWVVSFSRCA